MKFIDTAGVEFACDVTFSGGVSGLDLVVWDDLTVTDDAAIGGALTVGETLGVTGASTLAAVACTTLAASSNATVGGTLGITGATTAAALACTTLAASSNATVGGTLGITGTTTAAAVNSTALSASSSLTVTGANIVGLISAVTFDCVTLAAASSGVYGFASPFAGTITKIQAWMKGALTVGDAVLTGSIGGVAITNGVVTCTQAGSAAGSIFTANPTAANTVAVGSNVKFVVSGSESAAIGATVTVTILRSA